MRGEDPKTMMMFLRHNGSPPHARGRHELVHEGFDFFRITPACAGKTSRISPSHCGKQDHPRMRGEDALEFVRDGEDERITPACAGKTRSSRPWRRRLLDHPRMRGEDVFVFTILLSLLGSPPHARGRQLDSPGNPAKSSSSLPVFLHSQPNPLKRFFRRVLGL